MSATLTNQTTRADLSQLRDENRRLQETIDRQNTELESLRAGGDQGELAELKELVDMLGEKLDQSEANETALAAKIAEFDGLLDQKTQTIRELHVQVQELQQRSAAPPSNESGASAEELAALFEDLERERTQFNEEKAQVERERDVLRADEKTMRQAMRDMEVQMARERADMARQRNELQRLHQELKRELEVASRDTELRKRLEPLYRMQEEMQNRRSDSGLRPKPVDTPASQGTPPPPTRSDNLDTKTVRRSGFFGRLFGRGD